MYMHTIILAIVPKPLIQTGGRFWLLLQAQKTTICSQTWLKR